MRTLESRNDIKEALEEARAEIGKTIDRVDSSEADELQRIRDRVRLSLSDFIDINFGCG